jgi:hypothetical protein
MEHSGGAESGRKQAVKAGHAENLSGRDHKPLAYVVQRTGTDPTGAPLDCMQNRKQQVAARPITVTPNRESPFQFYVPLATHPSRFSVPQDRINSLALFLRRLIGGHVNIQFCLLTLAIADC